MKYLILICTVLMHNLSTAQQLSVVQQQDIQIVKLKQPDRSVQVFAINNSNVSYDLKFNITLNGMRFEKPLEPNIQIGPKEEVLVAVLLATEDQTNYKIHCQARPEPINDNLLIDIFNPDVTIYTKNEQGKSTQLRMYLKNNDIPFNEINVTYDDKSKDIYNRMLKRRGIDSKDANLPVVILKGEAHYDIKDMTQFIKEYLE